MGPCVVLFNVVVGCVVLYVLCVVLSVVSWDFLCLYCVTTTIWIFGDGI